MTSRLSPSDILREGRSGSSHHLLATLQKHVDSDIDCTDSSCKTALWLSLERGEVKTASCLIQTGANVNKTYFSKRTPLMLATEKGNVEMLQLLLLHGAIVDLCDSFGFSALMTACDKGWADCVRCLLDAGAQLHHRDTRGKTAMLIAAERGQTDCLELLLKKDASSSDKDFKGLNPLLTAVTLDHPASVKVLLQSGAWADARDAKGNTGVMLCVMHNLHCLKILLECGANANLPNVKGDFPIMIAAVNGCEKTLKLLVKSGAMLDVQDMQGSTALFLAAKYGHATCVAYLLSQGACPETKNNFGITAAMTAASANSHECLMALKDFAPLWINLQCNLGKTALMYSVLSCNVKCVNTLIQLGAQIELQDKKGFSALMCSMFLETSRMSQKNILWDCRLAILKLFIEAGVNLEASDLQGITALMHSTKVGVPVCMLQCLTSAGSLLSPNHASGKSALMIAASNSNLPCMEHLIEVGASVNAADIKNGKSALLYAAGSRSSDENKVKSLELLLKNGAFVNAQSEEKKTALMLLAETCTSPGPLNLLLGNGADAGLLDSCDNTAPLLIIKRRDSLHLPLLSSLVQRDIVVQWEVFCKLILSPSYFAILQGAIINGLMPLKPQRQTSDRSFNTGTRNSFIGAALELENIETALYFLACGFLNTDDFKVLLSSPQFRLSIEKYRRAYQISQDRFNQLLSLNLEHWPLVTMCFVTVSTLLGPSPGRADRVTKTQLPPKLQRKLLFQDPVSKLCRSRWPKILPCFDITKYECMPQPRPLLDHWPVGRNLTRCFCSLCEGKGYAFV